MDVLDQSQMNKVMIVTGGSRGIGAATASLAADQGYAICLTYLHNQEAANRIVDSIEQSGGRAIAVAADVASETDVIDLFNKVDEQLGNVTALVNNAGILEPQMRLERMDADRLNRVFGINIIGSFLCAREAVKRMSTRHGGAGGSIVIHNRFIY
jgi:NAD(P)-dependent dehydrogenase (short-subunit alcohol dehydrogenase family)